MARLQLSLMAFLCVTALASAATYGQAIPTRQEVNPTARTAPPPKSAAHVDERGAFAAGPCALTGSPYLVAIKRVDFTAPGGGALSPRIAALLAGIATDSAKQPISVVCTLRDEANSRLRMARYVAQVQIPAQHIEDGVLRLEVITGHIVQIRVRGYAGPFEPLIRRRIGQLSLLDPLNAGQAEKLLVLTNDVPGLSVQLGLSPANTGKPGDLIGELDISYRRFAVIANVQNYNSKLLGPETAYVRLEAYDLLGLNDRAYIAGATTADFKKQLILQAGESIGLSSQGDRLSLAGTYAYSRPALTGLDLRTLTVIGDAEFTHPLVRTVTSRLEAAVGFEYDLQRTRVYGQGGSVPFNRDRIAPIYARISGDTRKLRFDGSQKWSLSGDVEIRKGLDVLGATRTGQVVGGYAPTHFLGSATATIVRGQIGGTFAFGPVFELATTLRGQYANKLLLNFDQFAIGNLTIGRGYDPGANTGDRAIGGAHEIRINGAIRPNVAGQFYTFYDWVQLWNLDPFSTERSRFLRSVGGGARVTLANHLQLDITYAHPLDPPLLAGVNIKPSPDRLMFSVTTQFSPFGASR